jgi:DNA-binding transcriptional regulator of glucitol operon
VTNPSYRDPSKEYPPTRPTWRMMLAALAVVAVAAAFLNWRQVSVFAHVSQIETKLAHVL